jgi:release factor glutamine methyltransferase
MEELHGLARSQVYFQDDRELSTEQLEAWMKIINRLKQKEPIQYIFGKAYFFGLILKVSPAVLIPRPETEELLHLVLQREALGALDVLDIGTGSGCIALGLKQNRPQWNIKGVDVSDEALQMANLNAASIGLPVEFFQGDVLNSNAWSTFGEVWVSNPPYIPLKLKNTLDKEVKDHEPHLALFESEPFEFFVRILKVALSSNVVRVYFETHAQEHELLQETLGKLHPKLAVETVFDLAGKPRFLIVTCPK